LASSRPLAGDERHEAIAAQVRLPVDGLLLMRASSAARANNWPTRLGLARQPLPVVPGRREMVDHRQQNAGQHDHHQQLEPG